MRRLSYIFHIDIASINSMWIISGDAADGQDGDDNDNDNDKGE